MADTLTTDYEYTEPEVGGSTDSWGTKLNANWEMLDQMLASGFTPPGTPDGTIGVLLQSALPGTVVVSGDEYTYVDIVVTGDTTLNNLTVTGTFDTVGLTDSCTATRWVFADTITNIGTLVAANVYSIASRVADGGVKYSGGLDGDSGANLYVQGDGTWALRENATDILNWDGTDIDFNSNTVINMPLATTTVPAAVELSTVAEYRDDTANKALIGETVWDAAEVVALSDATTIAVDMSTFINGSVTLGGDRILGTPSNAKPGQTGFIEITQDGTGSRLLTLGTGWETAFGLGITLTTDPSAIDLLMYMVITSSRVILTSIKDIQ